jgi:hypothetical protein
MAVRTSEELEALTSSLDALPLVAAVDVTITGPTDPHVEVVIVPGADRVPPSVLRVLSRHDAGITSVKPQGQPRHYVVEVAA